MLRPKVNQCTCFPAPSGTCNARWPRRYSRIAFSWWTEWISSLPWLANINFDDVSVPSSDSRGRRHVANNKIYGKFLSVKIDILLWCLHLIDFEVFSNVKRRFSKLQSLENRSLQESAATRKRSRSLSGSSSMAWFVSSENGDKFVGKQKFQKFLWFYSHFNWQDVTSINCLLRNDVKPGAFV